MKECLHCKKEFQEKKETAKYCSDSCRVMFNRNKPKVDKGLSTESKLDVLYNAILEKLSSNGFNQVSPTSHVFIHTDQPVKVKAKTPEEWVQEKREIPDWDTESYQKWFLSLESSSLTKQQKSLIKAS